MTVKAEDKQALRRRMGRLRRALAPGKREALSQKAAGWLMASDVWRRSATIALYSPVRNEVDTAGLMRAAWSEGKTVLLPLCSGNVPGCMEYHVCPQGSELVPGAFGIMEPPCLPDRLHIPSEKDGPLLLVIPGLAFDLSGLRLGQGGGYYDRILDRPEFAAAFRMGLAYEFQIVEALPCDWHDKPVHGLCTDAALRFFGGQGPPSPLAGD